MHSSEPRPQRSSKLTGCLIWLSIPVIIVVILVTIFVINNRPATVLIPTPKLPNPNGYDDFIQAAKLIGTIKSPVSDPSRSIDSWTVSDYQAFVKDNTQAITGVRSGLQKDYRMPPTQNLDVEFGQYARFRELARVMVGESLYYSKIGQHAKAADSCLDIMQFGVTIPRGGPFIAMLVGGAVESIGSNSLSDILPELSPGELAYVVTRLERIQNKRVDFSDAIIDEGYASVATLSKFYGGGSPGALSLLSAFIPPTSPSSSSSTGIWTCIRYGFSNKNAMFKDMLAYYQSVAVDQKGHFSGKIGVPAPSNPLCKAISDSDLIIKARTAYCRNQSVTTLLQTEAALRRYKADNGAYPVSLAQLTPKYLKNTPTDPFGQGKPLCYKQQKNGQDFLLYSRYENLRDDGGKDAPWDQTPGKDLLSVN